MRIHELLKSAPYTQSHASEETADIGGIYMLRDAYHEHEHSKCGHTRPTIRQIRHHAPEHGHPAGYTHTPTAHGVSESRARLTAGADDDAHACTARVSIGKLSGAR